MMYEYITPFTCITVTQYNQVNLAIIWIPGAENWTVHNNCDY